jgi:CsoR family transcriptional regulator, copper-sensing transcriptional repressor
MKINNPEAKQKLNLRLKRIEGQVHGVLGMLDEERECGEILQQLAAIHSAVQAVSRIFLQEYTTICLVEMENSDQNKGDLSIHNKREKLVQDMIALMDKTP